jgi:hypothetical protein
MCIEVESHLNSVPNKLVLHYEDTRLMLLKKYSYVHPGAGQSNGSNIMLCRHPAMDGVLMQGILSTDCKAMISE